MKNAKLISSICQQGCFAVTCSGNCICVLSSDKCLLSVPSVAVVLSWFWLSVFWLIFSSFSLILDMFWHLLHSSFSCIIPSTVSLWFFALSLRPSICWRLILRFSFWKLPLKLHIFPRLSCVGLFQQTVSVSLFDLLCFNSNSSAARPWRSWACLITTCPTYQPPLPAWLTSKSWTSVKTVRVTAPLHRWLEQIWEQHKT